MPGGVGGFCGAETRKRRPKPVQSENLHETSINPDPYSGAILQTCEELLEPQSCGRTPRRNSVKTSPLPLPRHIAIIMDGNGRWAKARNLQRIDGHAEGAKSVRHAVETASRIGIEYLTLYAFSANNWARPSAEVEGLMALMVDFARSECAELRQNGIRVRVIGQTERLPQYTKDAVNELVSATVAGEHMTLTLALSYGARQDVLDALGTLAAQVKDGSLDPCAIDENKLRAAMTTHYLPDVQLANSNRRRVAH